MRTTTTRKMRYAVTMATAVLIMFGTNSCTKEGPAGPQGPAGANGSANVQTMTLNASSFAWDGNNYCRYAQWTGVSILTASVNSGGAVMIYESDGNGGWVALPYSFNAQNVGITAHMWFACNTGTVRINVGLSDGSDIGSFADTFKLVCIPPSQRKANPNLDYTNYNLVKKTFHLRD